MLQHTQSNQIYNYSTVHRSHRGEAKAVDRVIDMREHGGREFDGYLIKNHADGRRRRARED